MKYLVLGIAILCLSVSSAAAGEYDCDEVWSGDKFVGYACPVEWMKPVTAPKCRALDDETALCDKPIGHRIERDRVRPDGCGFRKNGKFYCR